MTKEPNAERLILSRFFHRNITTMRSKKGLENFENSVNFDSIVMENDRIDKRKKAKRKILGPQFKGFTNETQKISEREKEQLNQLVRKLENNMQEGNSLFRLSKVKIHSLKGNTKRSDIEKDRIDPLTPKIINIEEENNRLGFFKEDLDNSNKNKKPTAMERGQFDSRKAKIRTNIEESDSSEIEKGHKYPVPEFRRYIERANYLFGLSKEVKKPNRNRNWPETQTRLVDLPVTKIKNNIKENVVFESKNVVFESKNCIDDNTKQCKLGKKDPIVIKIGQGIEGRKDLLKLPKDEIYIANGNTKPLETEIKPFVGTFIKIIDETDYFFGFSKEEIDVSNKKSSEMENNQIGYKEAEIKSKNYFQISQENIDNLSPNTLETKKCKMYSQETIISNYKQENDLFGFSEKEMDYSNGNTKLNLIKVQIDLLNAKINTNSEKANDFFGFSKEEIEHSLVISIKTKLKAEDGENNTTRCCRGFSKQEQNESISALSDILEKCVSIRNEIYKNIDRRILTYHLKEERPQEKLVCSKYWSKKEDWAVEVNVSKIKSDVGGIKSLTVDKKVRKKNSVKTEKVQTDVSEVKQDNDFILEIRKIQRELKAIQNNNNSPPSQEIKPREAPFINIKRELTIPLFIPPKSPHYLIEEELYHDPWALLVATIFLNKTSGRVARPYIFWFLEENAEPLVVLRKKVEQLETYFGALGLQKTRASQVWRMSHDFVHKKWQRVSELYGIGRYGEEAFRMFCLGDFSFVPNDRYLRIYRAWYEMQEKQARMKQMNS